MRERERRLARIMPSADSFVRLVEGIEGRGVDFFRVVCEHDLEGVVAKWLDASYRNGIRTSWLKIRNPEYSQGGNRRELFEARRDNRQRRERLRRPQFARA